jgi:hypothetical protein
MCASKTRNLPADLENVRQQFERWRQTRPGVSSHIPRPLWTVAVKAAGKFGINPTSRALGLNYYSLKKQIGSAATDRAKRAAVPCHPSAKHARSLPAFLELTPPTSIGPCECTLEWEDAAGAKMRVHLTGIAAPDLAALSRSFWNPAP